MRELIFDTIFLLGTIIFILILLLFIYFLISKIYEKVIRVKYTNEVVAMKLLAKKNMECEKICKVIEFIRAKETK